MQVRSRKCIISQLLVKCYYDEVMHPERDWTTCLCSFSDVSFADLADSSSTGTLPAEGHMTTRQKQTVTLLTRTLHTSIHVGNLLTKYIKSKIHVLNTQQMVLKWSLYWHNVHATIDCKSVKLILKLEKKIRAKFKIHIPRNLQYTAYMYITIILALPVPHYCMYVHIYIHSTLMHTFCGEGDFSWFLSLESR